MKKFGIITLITTIVLCLSLYNLPANATQLPQPIVEFLKSKYPDVAIRFDGLVELPDNTMYLPVTPISYKKAENEAAIVQTIPANTDFTKKPDMILFANNLALLKIVRINNQLTVNYSPEIPLNVKLGLLPQDLIVPRGLVLPTELKVIMGNLKIALIPKKDVDDLVFYGTPDAKNEKKVLFTKGKAEKNDYKAIPELECLKNKVVYASNFKENLINIIDSDTGRITKTMKLPSVPSNMVLTPDSRYLLVTSTALSKLFIIDTFTNIFLKEIEVEKLPKSIVMPRASRKAYVANKLSSSISEIDLDNMVLVKNISVTGKPDNLTADEDNKNIIYSDSDTGNVYLLDTNTGISKKLTQINSISKMRRFDKYLLVLNRTDNELVIYNLENDENVTKVKVGEKPVDIKIPDNKKAIYVLSAGSDEMNIIDTKDFKVKNTVNLDSGGFPGSLNILNKENKILVTNHDAYQLIIFDMKNENIIGSIPISRTVSFLQISK